MKLSSKSLTLFALALLPLCAVAGCCCCQAYPLPGECDCPTDARSLYLGTGEEAVRRCPCGPDQQFYGLKPTCWRTWPDGWRCNTCSKFPDAAVYEEHDHPAPGANANEFANPFRAKPSPKAKTIERGTDKLLPAIPPAPIKEQPTPMSAPKESKSTSTMQPEVPVPLNAPPANRGTAPSMTKPENKQTAAPVTNNGSANSRFESSLQLAIPPKVSKPPATANPVETVPQPVTPLKEPAAQTTSSAPTASITQPGPELVQPNLSNRVEQHLINNLRL